MITFDACANGTLEIGDSCIEFRKGPIVGIFDVESRVLAVDQVQEVCLIGLVRCGRGAENGLSLGPQCVSI